METGHRPHLPQSAHEAITTASFADFASACLDQIVVAVKDDRVLGFIATEQADNFITDLWIDPDCESSGWAPHWWKKPNAASPPVATTQPKSRSSCKTNELWACITT